MPFDIRYAYLSDEESERLYANHPRIGKDPRSYCPTCNRKGVYQWKGVQYECDCELQLQLHKHYLAAGIGSTYQRLGWDDFRDATNKRLLLQYEQGGFVDRGVGLLLTGTFGVGKTMGCNLILKDLVREGYRCYATTFASMIEFYTSGWRDKDERKWFSHKVVNSDVLLLDDLGRELRRSNKLSESTFDDVLRSRVHAERATFLTTNLSLDELGSGYGAAALSLVREASMTLEFAGEDYRKSSNSRLLEEVSRGDQRPIL